MKMNKNLIAFRKGQVTTELLTNKLPETNNLVLRYQHLLMSYGYMLSTDAFNMLKYASVEFMTELISDMKSHFLETVGSKNAKELEELYHNFANETSEQKTLRLAKEQKDLRLKKYSNLYTVDKDVYTSMMSYCELIWNTTKNEDVPQVYEVTKFTNIDFVDETKFKSIFTNLIKIGTALTPVDFEIVEWFAKTYGDKNVMPNSIPFKENLCMVASLGLKVPVKTSTDVLRIATYMSNGTTDLMLPPVKIRENAWTKTMIDNPKRAKAKFKKFKRSERRYLLSLLEKVVDAKEMVLRKGRWLRLGEILHPGEYANRYPLTAKAFNDIRNTNVKSWYSEVDTAFLKSMDAGLKKLGERPGEYARRLDSLLRNYYQEVDKILNVFSKIGSKISSKVLWELYSHFEGRTEEQSRQIFIKGARMSTKLPTLETMDSNVVDQVQKILIKLITERFSTLEKLGNVFIDTELKKIPVPTNMRTLQDATKVVIRGTRMPLQAEKKVLRPYIHWTAGVDLDLSMSLVDKNGKTAICSYSNISPVPSIQHSGDVIPRVEGEWAEYIDINLKDNPYKYGLITVRNFSGGSLEDVGAVIGFMERDNLKSGLKWKPSTIENSFKVSSQGSNVNLLIIDFETMEWILVDEDTDGVPKEYSGNITKYIEMLSKEPKLSVYDVLDMHTSVRGTQVFEKEECDVEFNFDDFSTSYEKIAELML